MSLWRPSSPPAARPARRGGHNRRRPPYGASRGSFELVHARTLLINVPGPAQDVVAEMVRLARPGGWVAAMEPASDPRRVLPAAWPAFDTVSEINAADAHGRYGADPWIGQPGPRAVGSGRTEQGRDRIQDFSVPARGFPADETRLDLVRSLRPDSCRRWGWPARPSLTTSICGGPAPHLEEPRTVSSCPACCFPGLGAQTDLIQACGCRTATLFGGHDGCTVRMVRVEERGHHGPPFYPRRDPDDRRGAARTEAERHRGATGGRCGPGRRGGAAADRGPRGSARALGAG